MTGPGVGTKEGSLASTSKLYWSEDHQVLTDLELDVLGASAMIREGRRPLKHYRTDEPGAPDSTNSWLDVALLNARSGSVYAGV